MGNAIIFLIVFAAIQWGATFGIQALWKHLTGSPDITSAMLVTSSVTSSLIAGTVFICARWTRVSRNYIRTRPWSVLLWSCMAAVGSLAPVMLMQEMLPELPLEYEHLYSLILKDRWGYLAVGLLAPLVEEIVFRGAIVKALLDWKKSPAVAVTVSALLFALIHGNLAQMPHAFLSGLLLGWMYVRTGSILPGVAFHWVNNSASFMLYNMYRGNDVTLKTVFGSDAKVMLAIAFSLLILLPSLMQLHMRMKKA